MAVDYSFLSTRAMCDEASAEVDFELQSYTTRETVDEFSDTRTKRTAARTSARLTRVNAQIATQDILLATPGLDAETLQAATNERAALLVQRTALIKRTRLASGVVRFLGGVDAEQIDRQVETLTTVKAGIAAHRDTLSE